MDPHLHCAYMYRGNMYARLSMNQLAVMDFGMSIAVNNGVDTSAPYYNRSITYEYMNRIVPALADAHVCRIIKPNKRDYLRQYKDCLNRLKESCQRASDLFGTDGSIPAADWL
ncbi:hypothetical protein D3C80_1678970 [compost metagenome]